MLIGCGVSGEEPKNETAASAVNAETSAAEGTAAPAENKAEPVVTSFKAPEEYGKVIALTFDDGPGGLSTKMVLDTLEQYNARASFFLIGDNITDDSYETVRRAVELGCEINSHSKTHSYMDKMTPEEIKAEMEYTDEKIIEITGVTPRFFRPPYIAVNDTMYENIDKPFINGYGSNDWDESVSAEEITQRVLDRAEDGAIILLHDAKNNFRTPEAVSKIVPELQAQGYELVTVSELFHAKGVEPTEDGILYSRVPQDSAY